MNFAQWHPLNAPGMSALGLALGGLNIYFCFCYFNGRSHRLFRVILIQGLLHTLLGLTLGFFGQLSVTGVMVGEAAFILLQLGLCLYPNLFRLSLYRRRNLVLEFPKWSELCAPILVVLVSTILLASVRFHYSGLARLETQGPDVVVDVTYPFPNLSDEWYAAYFSRQAIESGGLPLDQSIDPKGRFFFNLQFPFHTVNTVLLLLFGLDPIHGYCLLAIAANVILALVVYQLLRLTQVAIIGSLSAAMAVLYIGTSSMLPTVWNYIPFHLGLIFFLILLGFLVSDREHALGSADHWRSLWPWLALNLAVIYYPLLIFYGLALMAPGYRHLGRRTITFVALGFLILVAAILIFVSWNNIRMSPFQAFYYLCSRVFFTKYQANYDYTYNLLYIIPAISIAGFLMYLYFWRRPSLLDCLLAILVVQFLLYWNSDVRMVLSMPRLVFLLSLVVIILSGQGLHEAIHRFCPTKATHRAALVVMVAYFLMLSWQYTTKDQTNYTYGVLASDPRYQVQAGPSVSLQYMQDDVDIFKSIQGKLILSTPWKSTVLAATTHNQFVVIQSGTLTSHDPQLFLRFSQADCQQKQNLTKDVDLYYLPHSTELTCDFAEPIGPPGRSFRLYRNLKKASQIGH